MKRLAIVPARGGSKRIPNKNIRDFCGKPMIAHVLETAQQSGLFDVIHLSTQCDDIRDVATSLGFKPDFARPSELADDVTPIMPVLRYVTEEYARSGQHFDEVWLLMACAPLVEVQDLRKAADLFGQSERQQPLLAICEYPVPIEWAFTRGIDGQLKPVQEGMFAIRSQDLEKKYYDAGCFAAFSSTRVLGAQGAGSDNDFIGYTLQKGTAIDIDEEQDWVLAEAVYRARIGQ